MLKRNYCLSLAITCLVVLCEQIAAAQETTVWIYRNQYQGQSPASLSSTERMFASYGYMPAERANQISVNPTRPVKADQKETCIEYSFQFKDGADWQGCYHLINGNAWGTKPGIDVGKLLGVKAGDKVLLKFRAWGRSGGEQVTFQCGGVNTGPHSSSLPFPETTREDPVRLAKDPRDYSIEMDAGRLSNVIDPFCVLVRAADGDNLTRGAISVSVDEIRFEPSARR